MDVFLVEIPENGSAYQRFPCIVEMPLKADINDFTKSFNWETVANQPVMFWRMPEVRDFIELRKDRMRNGNYLPRFAVPKQKETFCKPRGFIYEDCKQFTDIRVQLSAQGKLPLVVKRIYTGDVMYPFRFRYMGISNIDSLFYMFDRDCIYNGVRVPSFITHYTTKKTIRQGTKRIVNYLSPLVKLNDIGSKFNTPTGKPKSASDFMDLNRLDMTTEGSAQLEDIKKYFKLPFKPYLIFMRCMVFAGTKLICEVKETPPVPFGNNPWVNMDIVFAGLTVSQLPLEVICSVMLGKAGLQLDHSID